MREITSSFVITSSWAVAVFTAPNPKTTARANTKNLLLIVILLKHSANLSTGEPESFGFADKGLARPNVQIWPVNPYL